MREEAIIALQAVIQSAPLADPSIFDRVNVFSLTGVKTTARDSHSDLLSSASFPCIVITDNGVEQIEYKTAGYADVYVTVDIEIMVQQPKNQSSALNLIDKSIKAAIAAEPTLSGTVAHATILPQVQGDTQGNDNVAIRRRQVRLFYEATTAGGL